MQHLQLPARSNIEHLNRRKTCCVSIATTIPPPLPEYVMRCRPPRTRATRRFRRLRCVCTMRSRAWLASMVSSPGKTCESMSIRKLSAVTIAPHVPCDGCGLLTLAKSPAVRVVPHHWSHCECSRRIRTWRSRILTLLARLAMSPWCGSSLRTSQRGRIAPADR